MYAKTPLWAALRDTQGAPVLSSDPIGTLIASYPELRSLAPRALAAELGISEQDAANAIDALAADVFEQIAPTLRGVSFDELTVRAGAPAPAVWMTASSSPAGFATSAAPSVRVAGASDAMGAPSYQDAGDLAQVPAALRGNTEKGVQVLGFSYLIGQDRLHAPIEPDGTDPTLPNAADVQAFWRGIVGQSSSFDAQASSYDPNNPDHVALVRRCYASFRNYGPIPGDQADAEFRWNWDPDLAIKAQRHVYWYQFSTDANDPDPGQLCMQIAGWSEKAGAWLVAHDQGERVYAFHYRGNGEWRHIFNLAQWISENWIQILAYTAAAIAIVASVCTIGVGAALGAGIISASEAGAAAIGGAIIGNAAAQGIAASVLGWVAGALGTSAAALAGTMATVATIAVAFEATINLSIAFIQGDSRGALTAISSLWGQVQAAAGPEIVNFLKQENDFARAAQSFLAPVASAVASFNLKDVGYKDDYTLAGVANSIASSPWVTDKFPPIDGKYIDDAAKSLGGVGGYFFKAAQGIEAHQLDAALAACPDYAREFFVAGATINLVNAHQNAAIEAAQIKVKKTAQFGGFVSKGGLSSQARLASKTALPTQPLTPTFGTKLLPSDLPKKSPGPNPAPTLEAGGTTTGGSTVAILALAAAAAYALTSKG